MNMLEWIKIAALDRKSQKRHMRASIIFLMLSMIVFVGVNSIVGSIKDSLNSLLDKPEGHVRYFVDRMDMIDEIYQYLQEEDEYKGKIDDIFYSSPDRNLTWNDSREYVEVDDIMVDISPFYKKLGEYHCDGECREPQPGEVILPKYMYGIGIYNDVNYYDASVLIGKDIEVSMEGADGIRTETLTVIGTYDNVMSQMFNKFLLSDEQIFQWYIENHQVTEDIKAQHLEYMSDEEKEYIYDRIENEYNGDEEKFWLEYNGYAPYVCMYVEDFDDLHMIAEHIKETKGIHAFEQISLDESLVLYLDFLRLAGNLISGLLLLTTMVNIVLMTSAEISRREKDFALRRTQGFCRKDNIIILLLEKAISFGMATFGAIVVVGVFILCGNYVIDQLFPYYLKYIHLAFEGKILIGAIAFTAISILLGVCVALPRLCKDNLMEVLKRD